MYVYKNILEKTYQKMNSITLKIYVLISYFNLMRYLKGQSVTYYKTYVLHLHLLFILNK